jgi:bifunctional UDP-N-acetylglucosamine pyrophosphorylase/glucosamine-1-phosphate N-acetyltransferase/UDP-N-acetylglucosamine pyrophosphorylase
VFKYLLRVLSFITGMAMDYNDVGAIILAAGKGTRMKSDIAKVLHKVADKSMVAHVIDCAGNVGLDNIYVVIGHQAQKVKDEVNKYFKVHFVIQEELLGTGDAVKTAIPGLKSGIKDVLVLCGDVPLIKENTLRNLIDGHKKNQSKISVLATKVDDPTGYGRIVLDEHHNLLCIKEEAEASENEKKIKRVNTGIYCFDKEFLISAIDEIRPDNNQAEYYLTDIVEIAQKRYEKIRVMTMDDSRQVMGVNTLEELEKAEHLIQHHDK